jgi:hypothetical protein
MAKRVAGAFMLGWAISMVPMFFVVRHFENANVFDSIGTWYTLYVAAVFSVPVGLAVALGSAVFGRRASGRQ